MLKDITIGQYYRADSPVHRMDPRTKLLASFVFMAAVFVAASYIGYIVTFLLIVVATLCSNIPVRKLLVGIKSLWLILVFAFVLNLFSGGDNSPVLLSFWKLKITELALTRAIYMTLRLILLVFGTSILTLTTSPTELTDALESLFSPLKKIGFPAHEIAMMMTIALRFIPTLLEETDKIMKAQMARGADFQSGGLFKRARGIIPLLVPLFISAFRRAEELSMAMESRCYRGGKGRTRMKVLRFTSLDLVAGVAILVYFGAVLVDRTTLAGLLGLVRI